jgi:vacuolar-type H+-ATPase subunit I/STV1
MIIFIIIVKNVIFIFLTLLRYLNGKRTEECPFTNKRQEFENEIQERMTELNNNLKTLTKNTEELLNEYGYFSYVWCMIDTAVTKKESSDYSVMMVFAKSSNNNNVYILELVRLKERLPDFIQIVK